jgi:hypothetical protein
MLFRNDDAGATYTDYHGTALLFRAGGYWWDGTAWYRPPQVWDEASSTYYNRAVPAAAPVTAAGMLAGGGDPSRGQLLAVADIDLEAPYDGNWLDDLALWAGRRDGDPDRSVITLSAPELSPGMLIGPAELAGIAGIASSTLRSYMARSEARVPDPQVVIGNRSLWSRPVADEWAEQRRRSPEGVTEALSAPLPGGGRIPAGIADAAAGLARVFYVTLWDKRPVRTRWALRWRTPGAVREVADALGHEAASYMASTLIPADALTFTVQHAVLGYLAREVKDDPEESPTSYAVDPDIARMLGWLILHHPENARQATGWVIGQAESRLGIPRSVTDKSLRVALFMHGEVSQELLDEFFYRVLPPAGAAAVEA